MLTVARMRAAWGAGSAITACMGTVPGYWFTVGLVDSMGRVNIQYMGARARPHIFVLQIMLHPPLHACTLKTSLPWTLTLPFAVLHAVCARASVQTCLRMPLQPACVLLS